jgi:hypothetical protein
VRAYANVADQFEVAGYSEPDIARIKQQLQHDLNVREIIRRASGESLDLKAYEADMRHLSTHFGPSRMNLDTIRVYAISKVGWIKSSRRSCGHKNARRRASIWIGRVTTYGENATCSR